MISTGIYVSCSAVYPRDAKCCNERRLTRNSTPSASRLGAFGASIPCAPLPLSSAPPNEFCWRRAWSDGNIQQC